MQTTTPSIESSSINPSSLEQFVEYNVGDVNAISQSFRDSVRLSLPLYQQAKELELLDSVIVRQYADKSENYVVTASPGKTLYIGDIMCELPIDELTIYSDGVVVSANIYKKKATIVRSHVNDYGMIEDTQGAWLISK